MAQLSYVKWCLINAHIKVKQWAFRNNMIINEAKTAEIVFRRPGPNRLRILTVLNLMRMQSCLKVRALDIAPLRESSPQKRSGMARVLEGSQFYLMHTHTFNPQLE